MIDTQNYDNAVKTIKTAILQSQFDAVRGVNEKQIKLYYETEIPGRKQSSDKVSLLSLLNYSERALQFDFCNSFRVQKNKLLQVRNQSKNQLLQICMLTSSRGTGCPPGQRRSSWSAEPSRRGRHRLCGRSHDRSSDAKDMRRTL